MAKPITFFGDDSLLQGFKNTGAEGWSISAGSQFLTKGIGAETLKSFLALLGEGTKNTIYTLRIYEDVDDPKKIKEKTEADGSFNFVLSEKEGEYYDQYSDSNRRNRLLERIGNLETVIAKLAEGDDDEVEEEKPKTFIGTLMDTIKGPEDLLKLVNVGKAIMGMPLTPIPAGLGMIGAVPGNVTAPKVTPQQQQTVQEPAQQQQPDPDRIRRAQIAITILEQNDPKLIEHLEKLATLSQTNKGQFDSLLSMLDLFP